MLCSLTFVTIVAFLFKTIIQCLQKSLPSGICVPVPPFWTALEGDWPTLTEKKFTSTMNGSGSKHPKIQRDIDIYNFRHEGGIVAAKYDQPGYVHAMRLVVKDDMWSFSALYNTISCHPSCWATYKWHLAATASDQIDVEICAFVSLTKTAALKIYPCGNWAKAKQSLLCNSQQDRPPYNYFPFTSKQYTVNLWADVTSDIICIAGT